MNSRWRNLRGTATNVCIASVLLETFKGSIWIPSVGLGQWHRPIFKILSGTAGKCQSFSVPSDIPAGLYRFKKQLASPARNVTASFEILQ